MSLFALKSALSASDRIDRRRLILSDTLALVTLFAITSLLAVLTNYLYQSYASHQVVLAGRWLARGDQALREGKPQVAIDALSSALAFAPSERTTEIKLAQALASAGRVQEAAVYFNALLESQQGNGFINLQLAQLAAREGNRSEAIQDYQRAIYGNWEGDGYVRRRQARFELIHYLLSQGMLEQARSELLVAQGNAPDDDVSVQLEIAHGMDLAVDPGDALHLYKTILRHHASLREGLEGAGNAAFQTGRYSEAKRYLSRFVETSGTGQDPVALDKSRERLRQATRLLLLYPSSRLSVRERSSRILHNRAVAKARMAQCMGSSAPTLSPEAEKAEAAPEGKEVSNPLKSFASRFSRKPAQPTANPAPAVDPLQALAMQWQNAPAKITVEQLEKDPELAQEQMQLVYDTELTTRQVCGEPSGDDDLLLKIAQAPNRVEED